MGHARVLLGDLVENQLETGERGPLYPDGFQPPGLDALRVHVASVREVVLNHPFVSSIPSDRRRCAEQAAHDP